jgi:uncharacterized protein YmfQ (DUF2313 family)
MARSSLDYLKLLQSLLPRGKVWSRWLNAKLTEYLYAEAEELARIDNRTQDLVKERNTLYANELIDDHELDLGLPDECTRDLDLTLSERRSAANAKLTSTGGQSKEYFIDIAARYGYVATVEEYTPFWCGIGACGDPIGPLLNIFYWKLTIFTDETPIPFLCGTSVCGDSLNKISELLEAVFCYAFKYKPAHTQLLIATAGPGFSAGFDSGFDSLPSGSITYLTGGFDQGFTYGFNVNLGGGFSGGFDIGFNKPA